MKKKIYKNAMCAGAATMSIVTGGAIYAVKKKSHKHGKHHHSDIVTTHGYTRQDVIIAINTNTRLDNIKRASCETILKYGKGYDYYKKAYEAAKTPWAFELINELNKTA